MKYKILLPYAYPYLSVCHLSMLNCNEFWVQVAIYIYTCRQVYIIATHADKELYTACIFHSKHAVFIAIHADNMLYSLFRVSSQDRTTPDSAVAEYLHGAWVSL